MTNDVERTFEDGLLEGKIQAIESMVSSHGVRLDMVEKRISAQERLAYLLMGAIAFVTFAPSLKQLVLP